MPLDLLHVAPFDAMRYPPLINCVNLCNKAHLTSLVTASLPTEHGELIRPTNVDVPSRPGGAVRQLVHLTRRVRRIAKTRRPIVVIGHNARGLIAAWLAGAGRTNRLVYHCHDFDLPANTNGRVLGLLERYAVKRAAEFWVPAPERADLARELRIGSSTPLVVRNCPIRMDKLPARGQLRRWLAQQGLAAVEQTPIIVRHGRIGEAHCLRETIAALPHCPPNTVFVAIGDGDAQYLEACRHLSATLGTSARFLVHPFVPHAELPALLVDANVAMSVYAPLSVNEAAPAPNKVYESMAAGLPVIVTAGGSVECDVTRWGGGFGVDGRSPMAIADALARLLRDPLLSAACGAKARQAHLMEFNYETQLARTLVGRLLRHEATRS